MLKSPLITFTYPIFLLITTLLIFSKKLSLLIRLIFLTSQAYFQITHTFLDNLMNFSLFFPPRFRNCSYLPKTEHPNSFYNVFFDTDLISVHIGIRYKLCTSRQSIKIKMEISQIFEESESEEKANFVTYSDNIKGENYVSQFLNGVNAGQDVRFHEP